MKQHHDNAEPGLGDEASAFLDSVRGLDEPMAADRHRVRQRVLAAVAATGVAGAAGGSATAAAATTAVAGGGTTGALGAGGVLGGALTTKVWVGVVVGLVGAGVAGGVARMTPSSERPPVVEVSSEGSDEPGTATAHRAGGPSDTAPGDEPNAVLEPVLEERPPVDGLTNAATDAPAEAAAGTPSARLRHSVPSARASQGHAAASRRPNHRSEQPDSVASPAELEAPVAVDTLAAELALIRRAHAAGTAGNHSEVIRILDEHARLFPRGSLATERQGARAIALCAAGRQAEGRRAVEHFLHSHPASPLRARVSRACAE